MTQAQIALLDKLHEDMRSCRRCADAGHDIVPGAVFRGRIGSQVMLIGQAPGPTEAVIKRPFNAGSGRRLFQWLAEAGWDEQDFRSRHYMTAVTKCYPGRSHSGKGDRVPSREEQALCRPYLEKEVALIDPLVVLLVGKLAISRVFAKSSRLVDLIGSALYIMPDEPLILGSGLKKGGQMLTSFEGQPPGRFIVPLPHPSGASLWPNKPKNQVLIGRAMALLNEIRQAWGL